MSVSFSSDRAAPEIAGTAIRRLKPTAQTGEKPKSQRRADGQSAPAHAGQGSEHLGQADQQCVQEGCLGRSLFPGRSASFRLTSTKTAAVMRKPMPAALTALEGLLDPVDEEQLQRDQGERGDDRQQPDAPDVGSLIARGHVAGSHWFWAVPSTGL